MSENIDPLKQLIGTMYFSPDRNEHNQPVSKYEGMVVGFIVKKDDGGEFEVRSEKRLPFRGEALKKSDLDKLVIGDQVMSIKDTTLYTVVKVFAAYGDVLVKENKSGAKVHSRKCHDLRKVNVPK